MAKEKKQQVTLEFHYQKTPSYKTYNAGGVVGGITPKGKIFFDVFNDKLPLPKSVVHKISEKGTLGEELKRVTDTGVVREIECGIYLDIEVAVVLSDWLNGKINEYKDKFEKG